MLIPSTNRRFTIRRFIALIVIYGGLFSLFMFA